MQVESQDPSTNIFYRVAGIRKTLLLAKTTLERTIFLMEWRFLEVELLDFYITTGIATLVPIDESNGAAIVSASNQMHNIRKTLATHCNSNKLADLPPAAPLEVRKHAALIPVNVTFIVRLYHLIGTKDQANKLAYAQVLEWTEKCSELMRNVIPLFNIHKELTLQLQAENEMDPPGSDSTFFEANKIFPIGFQGYKQLPPAVETEIAANKKDNVYKELHDMIGRSLHKEAATGDSTSAITAETKQGKKKKTKRKKNASRSKTEDQQLKEGNTLNLGGATEVSSYLKSKWEECLEDSDLHVFDAEVADAIPYALYVKKYGPIA